MLVTRLMLTRWTINGVVGMSVRRFTCRASLIIKKNVKHTRKLTSQSHPHFPMRPALNKLALAVTMLLALSSVPVNTSATTNSSKGTHASASTLHVT